MNKQKINELLKQLFGESMIENFNQKDCDDTLCEIISSTIKLYSLLNNVDEDESDDILMDYYIKNY